MRRRLLGASGLSVGWLGLDPGCLTRHPDELHAGISMLLDAGGDLLVVGADADAQETVGRAVRHLGVAEQARLALRSSGSSRGTLLDHLDRGLQILAAGHVDLWLLDSWGVNWQETASAAHVALSSGRARYVALAPPSAWQAALLAGSVAHGPLGAPISALSAGYSLIDRRAETSFLPLAAALESGFIAAAPLGHGVLTGKYRHGTPPDSRGATEHHGATIRLMLSDDRRRVVDGVVAAAEGLGVAPAAVALAWLSDSPLVTAAVTSVRTVHQWRVLLGGADLVLPDELRSALNDVSTSRV